MQEGFDKPNLSQYSDYMFLGAPGDNMEHGFNGDSTLYDIQDDNVPTIDGIQLTDFPF